MFLSKLVERYRAYLGATRRRLGSDAKREFLDYLKKSRDALARRELRERMDREILQLANLVLDQADKQSKRSR